MTQLHYQTHVLLILSHFNSGSILAHMH